MYCLFDLLPTCGHKIKDKNVELSRQGISSNQSKYLGLSISALAEFMGLRQSIFMSYVYLNNKRKGGLCFEVASVRRLLMRPRLMTIRLVSFLMDRIFGEPTLLLLKRDRAMAPHTTNAQNS